MTMIVTMIMMMMMIMAPTVAVEWVILLLHVQEVSGFKLRYGERYPDLGFRDFSQSGRQVLGQYFKFGHAHFLPHQSQLIIY
jgi:hypothetical protein